MSDLRWRLVSGLSATLALCLPGCVVHARGLEVAVTLDLDAAPALREPRLTLVELLRCPGAPAPHAHRHDDASAAWSLALSARAETVLLTPVPGRYCDLRLQVEAEGVAPRQAVLPLLCRGARRELSLDTATLAAGAVVIDVSGTSPSPPDAAMQRRLDAMLGTLVVDACPP